MTYVDTNELWNIARQNGCKTIIEIANRLEINRNTVSEVMNGNTKPSSLFMERFVERFSVAPARAGTIFFKHNLHTT